VITLDLPSFLITIGKLHQEVDQRPMYNDGDGETHDAGVEACLVKKIMHKRVGDIKTAGRSYLNGSVTML